MFQSLTHVYGLELLKRAWIEALWDSWMLELAMGQLAALLHSKYTVHI